MAQELTPPCPCPFQSAVHQYLVPFRTDPASNGRGIIQRVKEGARVWGGQAGVASLGVLAQSFLLILYFTVFSSICLGAAPSSAQA